MDIIVKALTPDLLSDYLLFFDNMVFTENPDWSKCYCYSFHFTGADEDWSRERNREAIIQLINEDKLKGYLAFSGSKVVGWCNVNKRSNYQSLEKHYKLPENGPGKICSIVCFLIDPDFRQQGIARKLLEHIIVNCTKKDYDLLEAYPGKNEKSCEGHYKGPLSMYRKQGFVIINEFDNYSIVRKELK